MVCDSEIETQSTRLERNQHDLGVLAVEGSAVENLLHSWNRFRLAFSFILALLYLALLYTGRDVFFKVVVVGVISNNKVRVIAIGGILAILG